MSQRYPRLTVEQHLAADQILAVSINRWRTLTVLLARYLDKKKVKAAQGKALIALKDYRETLWGELLSNCAPGRPPPSRVYPISETSEFFGHLPTEGHRFTEKMHEITGKLVWEVEESVYTALGRKSRSGWFHIPFPKAHPVSRALIKASKAVRAFKYRMEDESVQEYGQDVPWYYDPPRKREMEEFEARQKLPAFLR